jgi:hypothetical protein
VTYSWCCWLASARARRSDCSRLREKVGLRFLSFAGCYRPLLVASPSSPHRARQRRTTLCATMRNVLQIVGFRTAVGLRRCDCGDCHPMSAASAGKQKTRQIRSDGGLERHKSTLARPNFPLWSFFPTVVSFQINLSRSQGNLCDAYSCCALRHDSVNALERVAPVCA